MKLSEIALRIDKSSKNEAHVDISEISNNEFGLEFYGYVESDRLKSYWIGNWCCTDTWVGYKMYFLDDEPVAFSSQPYRKSNEQIKWFNKESVDRVKEHILDIISIPESNNLEFCNINEDIGDGYNIEYNSNVTDWSYATFNSQPVKFIERIKKTPDYGIDKEVKILYNGEEVIVNITELIFKYKLNNEEE